MNAARSAAEPLAPQGDPATLRLSSGSRTDAGCVRALNEDRFIDRPDDGFWAVADGMGGHNAGDVAASRLITALETVQHRAFGYSRVAEVVRNAGAVNDALFEARFEAGGQASGATLVALLIQDDHYACLWAGDSRAYLFRDGRLVPITRDHSQVQTLVDAGLVDEKSRRHHPEGHLITRAVGAARQLDLESRYGQVQAGDAFLLCSDGLTACLDADEIAQRLAWADPATAAAALLADALAAGAPDNVTVLVARADAPL